MWKSNAPEYSYSWYLGQFQPAGEKVEEFLSSIDQQLFNRAPNEKTWSIAECFEHINEYNEQYLSQVEEGLERAESGSDREIFPLRFYWRWIANWFEPPYKVKIKTVTPFSPDSKTGYDKEVVIDRFKSLQDQYVELIRSARERRYDLSAKTSHPIFNFIKMRITECLAIVDTHQRRHIWQAEQILKRLHNQTG